MHKIYANCTENYYQEFEKSKSDEQSDPSQKYCDLFSHLVNDCGNIWNYCHDSAEVMDMKEMQIMSFYNYYDAFYVDTCDIVKQYNNKPFSRPEKCSEEEQISAQNLFQKCSHKISSNVYENIQNMTREDMVKKSLCKAMEEIEESCSRHLTQCLSNKDSSHILQPHLKNIRHFFNSFLQDMIPNARFTGCKDLSFKVSKELTSNLDSSKDKKNDKIYRQTTVETRSKKIDEKVKSTNLLNYLDTVVNTHLQKFDMNQDTKQDSHQSNTATQEETNTLEPDISKTQTLGLPAEIKDSDNFMLDKKGALSPDNLDADTDEREMSEVNQKTNEAIELSDSGTTKSEISNVLVVDNISNKEDKITIENQGSHQLNPTNSKEEKSNIVANKDSLTTTNNLDLLKETPRPNEKQDRSSSKQSLNQKKNKENEKEKDGHNSGEYSDGDVEEKGFEKDLYFTNNSEDDKRDFSSQQIQPKAEKRTLGRNEIENKVQVEVEGKGAVDTKQNNGEDETGVVEKNPDENLSQSDGQYGWTNWDTTDHKIVIPANTQENNGNAAVPHMNIIIQDDDPSNDKLVLPAPKDPKKNENATDIPNPGEESSSSVKLFTNVLFVLLTPVINFLRYAH